MSLQKEKKRRLYIMKTYVPAISWYVLVMIKSALFMAIRSAVN
jgi:hypothetical protein